MKNVEDIYPLSPMQQMMLLHAHRKDGQDVLFNQVCYRLTGKLDEEAFIAAWSVVLEQHPALRSLFLFEGLPRPMQVVRQHVELPFKSVDWRDRPESEKPGLLNQLRADDRARKFNPLEAPLLRFTLAKCEDEVYYLLWSSHHLILDRWCTPIIMRDLAKIYAAKLVGKSVELGPRPPYRDYIHWIESRNTDLSKHFWRSLIAGYRGESRLTVHNADSPSVRTTRKLKGHDWEAVSSFCRVNQLTTACLVQGAWSLMINRSRGEQDVVFGVVSSGRPPDVPEVESIIGSFITNLPVRTKLATDVSLGSWLAELQSQSRQRLPHEYVSLGQIRSWCELPPSQALFDSLIVWLAETEQENLPGLHTEVVSHSMSTAYPLTLYVSEQDSGLDLTLEVSQGISPVAPVRELLSNFCTLLLQLASLPAETRLETLPEFQGNLTRGELQQASPIESFTETSPPLEMASAEIARGRETLEPQLLEELVAAQWETVLGREDVPKNLDFFSAGGDSLMAASLSECLQRALRREIPMLSLFRDPTVSGMAKLILAQDWPVTARVATAIKEKGSLSPLFCVASPEVETIGYAILARRLGPERPAYVLQSPPTGESVRRIRPPEVPVLAQTYIDAMREIQPHGPYNLLGMCSGSQIGIEICRNLESQGESIAFSGILDTWAQYTLSKGIYIKKTVDRLHYYARRLRALRSPRREQSSQHAQAKKSEHNANSPDTQSKDGISIIETIGWPNEKPDLPRISSKITVYTQKRRKQYWRIRDPALGWGLHAQSVELAHLTAPGHKNIFHEPWVHELARDVDSRLADNGTSNLVNKKNMDKK